ncbi:MAG TPA: ABC transporter permease [Solirubrobacteraceae bacterium]|jgi:ABC-2 type transport system permease protein
MSTSAIDAIRAAGGTRIAGPRAIDGDWRRILALSWTLAYSEFRLKFFGSVLGYFWQLGRPLMLFGVYYLVFTEFVPVNDKVKFFPPLLLFGVMLYQFFAEATGASVQAVVARENLVRKIHFPRIVIPVSVVLTSSFNLALNMIAVGIFMGLSGVPLTVRFLELIPIIGLLLVFVLGLSMLLSALFVRYRDVAPIWDVIAMALFYGTPILYPLEAVQIGWARDLIMFNPLAVVQQQLRHALFDPSVGGAAAAIGGYGKLAIPIGIVVGTLLLGFYVFNRSAPEVAENL